MLRGGIVTREQAQTIAEAALADYFPGDVSPLGLRTVPPPYPDAAPAIVRAAIGGDAAGPPYTHRITGDYDPVATPGVSFSPAELGRKGGQSRASHLSPVERSASARKAAKARWGKADA